MRSLDPVFVLSIVLTSLWIHSTANGHVFELTEEHDQLEEEEGASLFDDNTQKLFTYSVPFEGVEVDLDQASKNISEQDIRKAKNGNPTDEAAKRSAESSLRSSALKNSSSFAKNLVSLVPTPTDRRALQRYLSLVNPDAYYGNVGMNNNGLTSYFNKFFKANPCFRRRAVAFYEEIAKIQMPPRHFISPHVPLNGTVESLTGGKLKPGWLWETAIKHANGDPELAMSLIGMCGHDDIGMGGFKYLESSEQTRVHILEVIARLKESVSTLKASIAKTESHPTPDSSFMLTYMKDNLARKKRLITQLQTSNSLQVTMKCPSHSHPFFYPESLGKDVNLPEPFQKKIADIQAPNKGAQSLPAKHYHVYGGAFMACEMIREGMSPVIAEQVERVGARMYRAIRLCETIGTNSYPESSHSTLSRAPSKKTDSKTDWDDSVTKDAASLYRSWYFGGVVLDHKLPCTDFNLSGPKHLSVHTPTNKLDELLAKIDPNKPRDWSVERFNKAKAKLATWLADSEWTQEEHGIGAKFAGKHCKKEPSPSAIEAAACTADGVANNGSHADHRATVK